MPSRDAIHTRPGRARPDAPLDGQTPALPTFGHFLDGTRHLPTPQPGVRLSVLPGSGGPWVLSLASWCWGKRLAPCVIRTIAPRRADPPMELPASGRLRSGAAQPWLGPSSAAAPRCPLERMAGCYVLLSPRVHRFPTAPPHVPTLGAPVQGTWSLWPWPPGACPPMGHPSCACVCLAHSPLLLSTSPARSPLSRGDGC